MKRTSSDRGFTLIELLIVTSILAVVGMVVYGTFARGVTLWQRVSRPTVTEDVAVFFKNIGYDLRNSFKLTDLRFRGGRNEMSFPTVVKQNLGHGIEDSVGQVTYAYDRRKKELTKSRSTYSQVYHKRPGPKRLLVGGVSSLSFTYFVYDAQRETYAWVKNWQEQDRTFGAEQEENLPLLVKIEIRVPLEGREQTFVRTVPMPSACCWPFAEEEKR